MEGRSLFQICPEVPSLRLLVCGTGRLGFGPLVHSPLYISNEPTRLSATSEQLVLLKHLKNTLVKKVKLRIPLNGFHSVTFSGAVSTLWWWSGTYCWGRLGFKNLCEWKNSLSQSLELSPTHTRLVEMNIFRTVQMQPVNQIPVFLVMVLVRFKTNWTQDFLFWRAAVT